MLVVVRVHLPSDIPVVGCELTPYVLLHRPDGTFTTDDIPETAPLDGYCVRYRWYRIQNDKNEAVCSIHPFEPATIQCVGCIKANLPVNKSFHCSAECFKNSWRNHQILHSHPPLPGSLKSAIEEDNLNIASSSDASVSMGNNPQSLERSGEIWYEVGRDRTYTPSEDDISYVLRLECTSVDATSGQAISTSKTLLTSRVIPAPSPSPRRMIPVGSSAYKMSTLDVEGQTSLSETFSVLSYNILADLYATNEIYSYCPPWALSWAYRRQNILREITGYQADILCLQEVQSDHFDDFFAPELEKHGYTAVYKKKTAELYTGYSYAIDGCATFFRRDRFSLLKKYEVEFNKAAQALTDVFIPASQKKAALSRLLKGNVALIVVLEAKNAIQGSEGPSIPGKRQLLCVANTHIHSDSDLKDVKLWQVHTLLKGLEKIAASADIPMLVCGDFSSVPGSAPHELLASQRVDPSHSDLSIDPIGILRPVSKFCHQLPLVSAYSSFAKAGLGPDSEGQHGRLDPSSHEPLFTNCTRDFLGTTDYIFFTADSLSVEALLELLDEECLRKDTALPSPEWSSDHVGLLAEFRCKPRQRC